MQLQQRGKARRLPDSLISGSWELTQTLLSHDSYLQVNSLNCTETICPLSSIIIALE